MTGGYPNLDQLAEYYKNVADLKECQNIVTENFNIFYLSCKY
jgi:hypothetical protein